MEVSVRTFSRPKSRTTKTVSTPKSTKIGAVVKGNPGNIYLTQSLVYLRGLNFTTARSKVELKNMGSIELLA